MQPLVPAWPRPWRGRRPCGLGRTPTAPAGAATTWPGRSPKLDVPDGEEGRPSPRSSCPPQSLSWHPRPVAGRKQRRPRLRRAQQRPRASAPPAERGKSSFLALLRAILARKDQNCTRRRNKTDKTKAFTPDPVVREEEAWKKLWLLLL